MGLGQWIVIIILVAIIIFGFAAVFDFSKGVVRNVYPILVQDNEPFIVGNVTKVIDGDTIDIQSGERIRFAIVNTPERGEAGYQEAKDFIIERCLGKSAVIDLDSNQKPTYGRYVGLVYCYDDETETHFVNLELLQQGLAKVMTHFCKFSEFKDGILCQYPIE